MDVSLPTAGPAATLAFNVLPPERQPIKKLKYRISTKFIKEFSARNY
jgi:hypothetical protein